MTDSNSLHVLLIEDNPGDAGLIRRMLSEIATARDAPSTYRTVWMKTLESGLACLREGGIDIVLCDLSLPDSSGLQTLLSVQLDAPHTPIVVLTGLDDQELAIQAVHAGAQDYLVKGEVTSQMLHRSIGYACERKRLHEQMRSYVSELEQRNAELDAFAHTVAHDLKNPVNVILSTVELLAEVGQETGQADQLELLGAVSQAGEKMLSIIRELLLLAQVNRIDVEFECLPMQLIVQAAQHRLVHAAIDTGATIVLHKPEEWPPVIGYEPWIEEVWVNYLSNALKYGGHPPYITIGADLLDDNTACYWIRDTGPGILASQLPQLFTEFSRIGESDYHGSGLGLSIVRRIVERLGGRASVKSEPGSGSTFFFTLPAAH